MRRSSTYFLSVVISSSVTLPLNSSLVIPILAEYDSQILIGSKVLLLFNSLTEEDKGKEVKKEENSGKCFFFSTVQNREGVR